MANNRSKEIWAECGDCEHKWAAVYLPMKAEKLAEIIKRMTCPKCGNTGKIFICEKVAND
jgi:ribosomal protein S27E